MRVIKWGDYEIAISKISLNDVSCIFEELGENMQVTSAECWEQVAFATILALKSFERGTNKAKTVKGEILIRLAGTLQIGEAIKKVGAKSGENFLVAFGKNAHKILEEFIKRNSLKEVPLSDCDREKIKALFEKAAIVEVL
ncbi:KEOPS complex subunit Cgi121 [Thermococcus sp. M39]|uniref:KEOPS complex subunit Cgi121 n=1 Tax=unclassified Thermococcus TaxID=2627626 RepID=UPI00143C51A8|nr:MULTISPECIES: KEOPS complex subunit Cgi121 [unclassified Thermococcus]NJE08609.1 KEOPS complex subunit Cgi121 [Thermococcus sp. M39]NJE13216.1 KEOPS complex subunit Cgi121 [Thermococcus sp. LS2]